MPRIGTDPNEAAAVLIAGGLVAIPTETVYGLAALVSNESAVAEVFRLKNRPAERPLIVHTSTAADFAHYVTTFPAAATKLAAAFLPGPLTMLLPRQPGRATRAAAHSDRIALRVPAHPLTQKLLSLLPAALAAPSANRFGQISPTCAKHVARDYAEHKDLLILDGGPCAWGIESTIVAINATNQTSIVRPGTITASMITQATGLVSIPSEDDFRAPGTSPRHYAPRTPLSILTPARFACTPSPSDGLLGFNRPSGSSDSQWQRLPSEPAQAGQQLYALLRELDQGGHKRILVEEPPVIKEAWNALRDRLRRAAIAELA